MKNTYTKYLAESKHLSVADQIGLLKILNSQMGVAEKLIKRTFETIAVIPLWKEI